MRTAAALFTGVAVFFAASAAVYYWTSQEPAGSTALVVATLMATLVAFFLWVQAARLGRVAQDDSRAEVIQDAGAVDFFPPDTAYPLLAAAGTALCGLGVVIGPWLFLIGLGVLAPGVLGFVFEHLNRSTGGR